MWRTDARVVGNLPNMSHIFSIIAFTCTNSRFDLCLISWELRKFHPKIIRACIWQEKYLQRGPSLLHSHREMLNIFNFLLNNLVEIDCSVLLFPLHFWKLFNLNFSCLFLLHWKNMQAQRVSIGTHTSQIEHYLRLMKFLYLHTHTLEKYDVGCPSRYVMLLLTDE